MDTLRERILCLREPLMLLSKEHEKISERVDGLGIELKGVNETLSYYPEIMRANLRKAIEAQPKLQTEAERAGANNWRRIDEIERWRQIALAKMEETITFIQSGLAGDPDPVFKEATRILQENGADEALTYLESKQAGIFAEAAEIDAEAKKRVQEKLRPIMLQAELLETRMDWNGAVRLLEQVVQQAPDWFEARTQLARILFYCLARFPDVEKHLRVLVATARSDSERATSLNNLGQLLKTTNRLDEAELVMRQVLDFYEVTFVEENPRCASALNNLATLLHAKNSLEEAEQLMRRSLRLYETTLGSEHTSVAMASNNLAQILVARNRFEEAEQLMETALRIYKAAERENQPDVAKTLNNLGRLFQDTARLEKAEELMRQALAITKSTFGDDHPDVAGCMSNLAGVLIATNRL